MGWTLCITVVGISLECGVMVEVLNFLNNSLTIELTGNSPILATYFGLFIFGLLFQLVGAVDASYSSNTMQVLAVSLFNVFTTIYSVIQIFQVVRLKNCAQELASILTHSPAFAMDSLDKQAMAELDSTCYFTLLDPSGNYNSEEKSLEQLESDVLANMPRFNTILGLSISISVFMILATAVGLFISYRCYNFYGWNVYYTQGADLTKKRMLERYHLFVLLLKTNAYFFLGLSAQVVAAIYFDYKKNQALGDYHRLSGMVWGWGVVLVLIVVVYYALGFYGAKTSNRYMMMAFIVLCVVNLGYLIYLLSQIGQDMFQFTIIWLVSFVVLQMLTNLMTIGTAYMMLQDFQRGFSAAAIRSASRQPGTIHQTQAQPPVRFAVE
ncbi:hypothetical protein HDV03_000379 [Kappamyces sp. JEL0829]|nr:hypothetical protein HDV03_000379 [Kappamyces sp. JEL0829]